MNISQPKPRSEKFDNNNNLLNYLPDNVANLNGLDGSGIRSRWGGVCFVPVPTASEAYPASCTMSTETLPGVKRPELRAEHLPHSTSEAANGRSYTRAYPLCLQRHIMG